MRKKIIILCFVIIAIIAYKYVFKNHRNIALETTSYNITTTEIAKEFQINSSDSESKYLDKTIEVSGLISEIDSLNITLEDKVFCQFSKLPESEYKINDNVKIKGRFIGYDNLLEQIKIDQCFIIN